MVRKIFKFMVFIFLENLLKLGIFIHDPYPVKTLPEGFIIPPFFRQREITRSPRQLFFENLCTPTAESTA